MGRNHRHSIQRDPDRSFIKGLLYGMAFFLPGVFLITYWNLIERVMRGMSDTPVITTLSRDFRTGLSVAGDLFSQKSADFYRVDTSFRWKDLPMDKQSLRQILFRWEQVLDGLSEKPQAAPFRWDRSEIEEKLAGEFSARTMRRATKYLDYIEQYKGLASNEMAISRIPASVTLAQGILESDAGEGYLALKANNHFGIKCRKRPGYKTDGVITYEDYYPSALAYDCEPREDDNPWDHFEKYESVEQSYRRHTLLLHELSRYNWMIDAYHTGEHYEVDDEWFGTSVVPYYAAWSIGLQESGYATGKRYYQKLALIIETYELWRIDYEVVVAVS
jgi:uncharacterized FlgJ-related protein